MPDGTIGATRLRRRGDLRRVRRADAVRDRRGGERGIRGDADRGRPGNDVHGQASGRLILTIAKSGLA